MPPLLDESLTCFAITYLFDKAPGPQGLYTPALSI